MTTSRWANWGTGSKKKGLSFDKFVVEAPMQTRVGPTSPAEQAHKDGLSSAGYGWWRDRTGQVVARTIAGELQYLDRKQDGAPTGQGAPTPATLDMGNPTSTASAMTPADKARSMGLQSNGSGGYVDQQGNVAARTVNNELVFYDSRAGGGAVSDGSAGALITQSSPSWVDPETGLIIVPPAQPESPEEVKAVPDPVPAQLPFSYDAMMIKRKREIYTANANRREAESDLENQTAQLEQQYASSPGLQNFYTHMNELIEMAQNSGMPEKAGTAAIAMDIMADNVEAYQHFFDYIPEEQHEELVKELTHQIIGKAKYDWFEDNIDIPEDMDYWDEMDERKKYGAYHHGGGHGPAMDTFRDSIGMQDIPDRVPPENGEEDIETVEGDYTQYFLRHMSTEGNEGEYFAGRDIWDKEKNSLNHRRDPKQQLANKWDNPKNIISVSWDSKEEFQDTEDPQLKKKMALDAVKTWRTKILPELDPGTIVHNQPNDEQKARIYSLAGFADPNENNDQWGIVITGKDGKNEVVPLGEQTKGKGRMDERYLGMLDGELNTEEVELVYEMLLT